LSFEFDYNVLGERLRIQIICRSEHSMIKSGTLPLRCRPQQWLTQGRGEHTCKTTLQQKPEQLKLNKTYPSTWS
jgi:hypothetical protein